ILVRRIARPLLAPPFVYGGISPLRRPQDRVPGARPVVEKIAETADKQLPVQVPRDVEQWVKADAAVKVAAGTEGKPSVGYRARKAAKRAADATEKNLEKAQKRAAKAQKTAEKKARKT